MKDIAIVYMVAGLSSRFGGKIKQFAKVGPNGETLIEISVNQAIKAGFNKIVFVVGNLTEKGFKEIFKDNYRGVSVQYAYQKFDTKNRDKPWGTTDAVCSIKNIIDCPFVICNGDDIYGENTFKILLNHLQKSEEGATIGYKLKDAIPETGKVKRGIFIENKGYVKSIVETFNIEKNNLSALGLTENSMCSQNIFAMHPVDVDNLNKIATEFKEKNKGNRTIELLLPVDITSLIEAGKLKLKVYSTPDKWIGITNPEDEDVVREMLKNS